MRWSVSSWCGFELKTAPQLVESFGIGPDTAAEILIVVGDNPERIKSEAALAKLAGINPIPASYGMTSGRYRQNALPSTHNRVCNPAHHQGPQQTRHHPRGLPPHPPRRKRTPENQLTTIGSINDLKDRDGRIRRLVQPPQAPRRDPLPPTNRSRERILEQHHPAHHNDGTGLTKPWGRSGASQNLQQS
jgi:hypothetical protein